MTLRRVTVRREIHMAMNYTGWRQALEPIAIWVIRCGGAPVGVAQCHAVAMDMAQRHAVDDATRDAEVRHLDALYATPPAETDR